MGPVSWLALNPAKVGYRRCPPWAQNRAEDGAPRGLLGFGEDVFADPTVVGD